MCRSLQRFAMRGVGDSDHLGGALRQCQPAEIGHAMLSDDHARVAARHRDGSAQSRRDPAMRSRCRLDERNKTDYHTMGACYDVLRALADR